MVHAEHGKGALLALGQYSAEKLLFLEMSLRGDLHIVVDKIEKGFPVPAAPIGQPGQVQRDILKSAEPELPRRPGIEKIPLVELEAQAAAF